jgi:bbp17
MSVLKQMNPTLADVMARTGADGRLLTVVEILDETNGVIDDLVMIEANGTTAHKTTIRSGLPEATWRMFYQGVQPSKTVLTISDAIGMLEAYAETDKSLCDLNGNSAAWRMNEERAFLEAMAQKMAQTLFYSSQAQNGAAFNGLAPRFSDLHAENARNIVDGGGTGADNTSIWLVVWGANTCHGIYPKGTQAGLQHKDLGEVTLNDENNGRYQGYRSHYKWDLGLSVRDWRYVVRIANVDVKKLTKDAKAGADLIDLMTQAAELIPNLNAGKAVFYCNREIRSILRRQIANRVVGSTLTMEEVAGKKVVAFDGIPVRICDQLLSTEERVK